MIDLSGIKDKTQLRDILVSYSNKTLLKKFKKIKALKHIYVQSIIEVKIDS